LDNIFFQLPNDPRIEAEINQTSAELTSTRAQIQSLLAQALAGFRTDVPNGISLFTGEPSTFAQYEAVSTPVPLLTSYLTRTFYSVTLP
jgi:hypothetical protein